MKPRRRPEQIVLPKAMHTGERTRIELLINRRVTRWGPYLVAALLSEFNQPVYLDAKELDETDPAKMVRKALGSLRAAVKRRAIRGHLQVLYSAVENPYRIWLVRKSPQQLSQQQAEAMVYGGTVEPAYGS